MNVQPGRIRVLVVEDSPVQRDLQVHLLNSDPGLEVVGTARDGQEAVERVQFYRPDVVSMDFHMPRMDGATATRIIMETQPLPIVIVSGSSARSEVAATFRALEAGAVQIIEKPGAPDSESARKFVDTVKLMAEVKVVRRRPAARQRQLGSAQPAEGGESSREAPVALVAIGASTGGPLALCAVLKGLPSDFPAPVAIVQHISPGFTEGFAEWLASASGFPVRVVGQGDRLLAGQAYVAPDGLHLTVMVDCDGCCRARLVFAELESGHRPSVSPFFRSVAAAYGKRSIAVLLTGMGKDGAAELRNLREAGAVTIAQDPRSAVVPGMPGEAIRLDAATHVLPPEHIGGLLVSLVRRRAGGDEPKDLNRGIS